MKMKHHDFEIGMPEGWIDASNVILVGPAEEQYRPSITITREQLETPTTAREFAMTTRSELEQELQGQGFEILEEGSLKVGDMDCFQRKYTLFQPQVGVKLQQMQVYIVKEKKAIIVTCSDKADRFEDNKQTFMDAIEKFEFTGED